MENVIQNERVSRIHRTMLVTFLLSIKDLATIQGARKVAADFGLPEDLIKKITANDTNYLIGVSEKYLSISPGIIIKLTGTQTEWMHKALDGSRLEPTNNNDLQRMEVLLSSLRCSSHASKITRKSYEK